MSADHGSRATRTEKDSLGTKEIPAQVYYGIQTARAVENYPISGVRTHPTLVRAVAMVKEAAAEANRDLKLVDRVHISRSSFARARPPPCASH